MKDRLIVAVDKPLEQRCEFATKRLRVQSWKSHAKAASSEQALVSTVIEMLTPAVSKSLPDGWQGIDTEDKALEWLRDRAQEGAVLTIEQRSTRTIIGFLFLYGSQFSDRATDVRLGYILAESVWGNGLGTELIAGLVQWCTRQSDIQSLSGGVDVDNIGSIKVLQRNGFTLLESEEAAKGVAFYGRQFNMDAC